MGFLGIEQNREIIVEDVDFEESEASSDGNDFENAVMPSFQKMSVLKVR